MNEYTHLVIQTDGGARGNPGPAAIGVVVKNNDQVIYEKGLFLGKKTNNEAEYLAFKESVGWLLEFLKTNSVSSVEWRLDSMLVVEQLNKKWKIKETRLAAFAQEIWQQLQQLAIPHTIVHVPRSENAQADALVNQALDSTLAYST